MINFCFSVGIFPNFLKIAIVLALLKKGDPFNLLNYRPISLLHFISKIFEKCLFNRLHDYSISKNIISERQFGFLRGKSTEQAIVSLTEYLYKILDDKEIALNVFIDFRKAFDTVDHCILLKKLERYGIRGMPLKLVESYLSNRSQKVRIGDCVSELKEINFGVPQGSILGPFLFLLYVNDLPNISPSIFSTLYADDTTITLKFNKFSDIEAECNVILLQLFNWTLANRLSLNFDKTYFNLITKRSPPRGIFPLNIHFKGHYISYNSHEKFLGVIFDDKLKFNYHIDMICSKISKSIGIIYRIRNLIPKRSLLSLYYSFIFPYLNYCNLIWGGSSETYLQSVFVLQKRAVRAINHVHYLAHSNQLFLQDGILKLPDLHSYLVSCHMFKCQSLPNFIRTHDHNTRNRNSLLPEFHRLSLSQRSLNFIGPNTWNCIPDFVKESPNIRIFKSRLRNHLLLGYSLLENIN